jgi:hypothetical protein
MTRTQEFLIAAIGDIGDPDILQKVIRKANRTLKALGQPTAQPTSKSPVTSVDKLKVGDELMIGTTQGQQTKVKVAVVNRKRVKVQLLEDRGVRKVVKKGEMLDIYPDMIRKVLPKAAKDAAKKDAA